MSNSLAVDAIANGLYLGVLTASLFASILCGAILMGWLEPLLSDAGIAGGLLLVVVGLTPLFVMSGVWMTAVVWWSTDDHGNESGNKEETHDT